MKKVNGVIKLSDLKPISPEQFEAARKICEKIKDCADSRHPGGEKYPALPGNIPADEKYGQAADQPGQMQWNIKPVQEVICWK